MVDRISAWVAAGVLAVGVSMATIAGANVATATPDAPSDGSSASSSETGGQPKAAEPKADSMAGDKNAEKAAEKEPDVDKDADPDLAPSKAPDVDESTKPTQTPTPTPAPTPVVDPVVPDTDTGKEKDKDGSKDGAPVAAQSVKPDAVTPIKDATQDAADEQTVSAPPDVDSAADADESAPSALVAQAKSATDKQGADPVSAATLAAAQAELAPEPAAPAGPTLINVLGTIAWSLFDFVSKILEGPPSVPAGSAVSVGRSKLEIDCGDGYTADADWYFPTSGQPDKLIYFQHGFPARAGFYNLTAAELAERNNAIVVAPSITGNFFACDGCSLSSDQMHAAVAKLFMGDRAALLASAQAAGYEGTLPEDFVIAGHSGGGQLAAGAAGYYYELAPAADKSNLVGALLLDTSASGGALARALDKLPTTVPVLHIAAGPTFWNTFGNANEVLEEKRSGQFNGVQLVSGTHSDAFRSSGLFGFTQLIVSIGTGFSAPENVDAVQVLAEGWIADMYAGTVYDPDLRQGIYGELTSTIAIPTGTGTDAHAYVLPVPPPQLGPIELLIKSLLDSVNLTTGFAGCAVDPSAVHVRRSGEILEKSPQNAALSLDGRSQTVQSVGQHVCTG